MSDWNRKLWRGLKMLLVSGLFLGTGRMTEAAVIYRETFGNAGGSQSSLATAGWTVYAHATGDNITAASPQDAAISNIAGRPSDLPNVNAGTSPSTVNGLVFVTNGGTTVKSADPVLFSTTEYTVNRSVNSVDDFSFYLGDAAAADVVRVAIQIGGKWYVSTTSFSNSTAINGANFSTTAELRTLTFSTAASAWSNLNFVAATAQVPGTLGVGSALTSSLPGGNITGFGLYSPSGRSQNVRFDTFTIDATVPEPASLGVVAIGAIAALRRRGVAGGR